MQDEFADIVRNESRRLHGLCFRLTGNSQEAEDLCQDALARAFKSFDRFEGRAQISTWLYRIALNAWKNKMRTKKSVTLFGFFRSEESSSAEGEPTQADPPSAEASLEVEFERSQSEHLLQSALQELDKEHREIIVLRDIEDNSYEELADLLSVPIGTVKSRLARAREALRLKLIPILKAKGELP